MQNNIVTFQCPVPGWNISFSADPHCMDIIRKVCGMFQEIKDPDTTQLSGNQVIFQRRGPVWECKINGTSLPDVTEAGIPFYVYESLEVITDNMPVGQLLFHGGAVCRDGHALGIFAPTRTGKSTLVTALCTGVYQYLSDDYLFLDPNHHTVYACPKPIMLRDVSLFGESIHPYILTQGENTLRHERDTLLVKMSVPRTPPLLDGFILLNRTQTAPPGLMPLGGGRTFLELMRNTKRPHDLEFVHEHATRLAEIIKAYVMTYETIEQASQMFKQLFGKPAIGIA